MEQRLKIVVNTKAISENVGIIKKMVSPETIVMAVVKADGYGHGATEAAKAALRAGAGYLGVATAEEGVALRHGGIDSPILVLGATFRGSVEEAVRNSLAQTVINFEAAAVIAEAAKSDGRTAVVHIKVDTGMNRIGFTPNGKSVEEIRRISGLEGIVIEGIYSHFAESDAKDKSFSVYQAGLFMDFCRRIEETDVHIPVRHMSNSGAVLTMPQFKFDMVRPGIIIYGLPPSPDIDVRGMGFKPAMTAYSEVVQVKEIPENTSVGYNRTFFSDRKIKVATIPIGYADAYPRLLSNKGRCIIRGQYARIIGNICMDQMMADVTGIDGVCPGDEVTVIGGVDVRNEVTAEEIARNAGTINYEIVCAVGAGKRGIKLYL